MTMALDPTVGAAPVTTGGDVVGDGHRAATGGGLRTAGRPREDDGARVDPGAAAPSSAGSTRDVSGRYQATVPGWQVELRIDVDGSRPTRRVSGDLFATTGATTSYSGSFVVDGPEITVSPTGVVVRGQGRFTWTPTAPFVTVTVPRVPVGTPQEPALLRFSTPTGGQGASYSCSHVSPWFRTVAWEQDSVAGAAPLVTYDSGQLSRPPGVPARLLSVSEAYSDAGIQLLSSGVTNVLPISDAGAGASPRWSDSELHNAMVKHFSSYADAPRWQVWLLVATAHDDGYRGIMFDYAGAFQRQGCAVFYEAVKGDDPASQRSALRTYVHELGHAFNLLHSWQKHMASPPAPLGPNAGLGDLSWMNYAWRYQPPPPAPGGEPAYWAAFPFQFTTDELVHLRHGFYRDVVMSAAPFGQGAAETDPEFLTEPVVDHSGLALELRARPTFAYGEPVVVELKLSATDLRGQEAHAYLHPKDEFVTVAVRQPSGRTVLYRPLLRHCVDDARRIRLDPDRPAVYDSAYIGHGRDGQLFDQPGRYALRGVYTAGDGSRVVSPVTELRVRPPLTAEDQEVGELLLGEEQGQVLALLGSSSDLLQHGNTALDTVLQDHPDHPLAVYARLVKGIDAARDFKDLGADGVLRVRPADPQESIRLLSAVEDASVGDGGVDNITLNAVMRTLATAEARAGDPDRAREVARRMVTVFEQKALNDSVLRTVRRQAEATVHALAAATGEAVPEEGPRPASRTSGTRAGGRKAGRG